MKVLIYLFNGLFSVLLRCYVLKLKISASVIWVLNIVCLTAR